MPALSIMIKPASSLCNLRCKYCHFQDKQFDYTSFTMQELKIIIDNIHNYCKEKGYVNSPTEYRYKEIEATDIIKLKSCKAHYEVSKSNTNDNKFIVRFKACDEEHIAVAFCCQCCSKKFW